MNELEKDFFEEEIKKDICNLGQDKAPGPDSFPTFFFHIFLTVFKEDLYNLFRELNNGGGLLDRPNCSFVVLIPKKNSLETIPEYRPIALLNSELKIFSKILAHILLHTSRGYPDRLCCRR